MRRRLDDDNIDALETNAETVVESWDKSSETVNKVNLSMVRQRDIAAPWW
jgi:hypothetical protein